MREILKLRSVVALLTFLFALNSNANECEQFNITDSFQCDGTFIAKDYEDLEEYISLVSVNNDTYKNLVVDFKELERCKDHKKGKKYKGHKKGHHHCRGYERFKRHGRKIVLNDFILKSPCSISFDKNSKVELRGETCISSKSEINVGDNSSLLFNSLNLVSEKSIEFGKNIKILGKNLRLYSYDSISFSKNTKIFSKELEIHAKECSQEKHVWGLGSKCKNPIPPITNIAPVAKFYCNPVKNYILCYGHQSSDEDGQVVSYKYYINGELIEQSSSTLYKTYEPGIYNIELEVVDNEGAVSQKVQVETEVIENLSPIADFSCEVTDDLGLQCDASNSSDPDDTELNYIWNAGGSYFSGVNPYMAFGYPAVVNVTLTVQDPSRAYDVKSATYEIKAKNVQPIASLSCESNGPNHLKCDGTNSIDPDGVISKYVFDVNGQKFENTTGIFESTGFSGNIYVTLVVYDEFNLVSSEVYSNIYVYENSQPVAGVICDSQTKFNLTCNAMSSYDSDGWIQTYVFNVNGTDYVTSDGLLDINLSTSGNINVSLIVYDNLGKNSEPLYRNIYVIPNKPPRRALMNCYNNGAQRLHCSGAGSSDPDDNNSALSFEWTYDNGRIKYGEEVDLSFSMSGSQTVSLKVTDPYGEFKTTEQTFYLSVNQDPIVGLSCKSDKVFGLSCDASQSEDSDGDISNYSWYIDGELIHSSQEPLLEYIKEGLVNVNIVLIITDNLGATDSTSSLVSIKQPSIYADFICEQTDNYVVSCSIYNTFTDYGEINKYEWLLPDGTIKFGESTEISFEDEGTYQIGLTVRSSKGGLEKLVQKEIEVVNKSMAEYPSDVLITTNIHNDSFFPVDQKVFFQLSNGSIHSDLDIVINGDYVDDEFIQNNSSSIEISNTYLFREGENNIVVNFYDELGKLYSKEWKLYYATKDTSLSVLNDKSMEKSIDLILLEDRSKVFHYSLTSNDSIRVPDKDLIVVLKEDSGRSRIAFLAKGESSVSFDLADNLYPKNSSNFDFSNEAENWHFANGSFSITNDYPDVNDQIAQGRKLSVSPDENGIIHYSTELHVNKDGTQVLELPILFNSSDEKSFYVLRLKNKSTGEEKVNVVNINDISSSGKLNSKYQLNTISGQVNSDIEYEVFAKFYNVESLSLQKGSSFISSVYAQQQSSNSINIAQVVQKDFSIIRTGYLYDTIGKQRIYGMANLPTGEFKHFTFVSKLTQEHSIDMEADIEFSDADRVNSVSFLICPEIGFSDDLVCKEFPAIRKDNKIYLSYKSNEVTFDSNFLEIKIKVYAQYTTLPIIRNLKAYKQSSSENIYFRNIVEIESESPVLRYGNNRDSHVGGDSWVSRGHLNTFLNIMNTRASFLEKNTDEKRIYDLKANDFNGIQGHSLGVLEADLGHREHNDGVKVDLRWNEFAESDSEFSNETRNRQISSLDDAIAIDTLLRANQNYNWIDKILVTSDTLKQIKRIDSKLYNPSQFNSFSTMIASSCLPNGRLLSDVLIHSMGHSDHFDLKVSDFNSSRNSIVNLSKNYYIMNDQYNLIESENQDEVQIDILKENVSDRYFYYKNEEDCENCNTYSRSKELVVIPRTEQNNHPIYISGNSIRISRLYLVENGVAEYLESEGISKFRIKVVVSDTEKNGCGSFEDDISLKANSLDPEFSYVIDDLTVNFTAEKKENGDDYVSYEWEIDGKLAFVSSSNIYGHTFENGGEHVVTLKVTDEFGLSDFVTKTLNIVESDTVTICNIGLLESDMNFTISGHSSFTLSMRSREPYYNICDCKELNHPVDEVLDVYVDGTAYSFVDGEIYASWNLMPYSGQIIVGEYTQIFSTGIPSDREVYLFSVHRGQWAANYCQEYIYK